MVALSLSYRFELACENDMFRRDSFVKLSYFAPGFLPIFA